MIALAARGLGLLSRLLAVAGLSGLLLLAVMTLADGLLRTLVNHPIDAVRDLGGVVAAMSVACCVPIALNGRSNITIRFLGSLFGPAAGGWAERFAALVVLVVTAAMARSFYAFAAAAARNGDATWILNIPTAPFWFVVDTMLWLGVVIQLLVTAQVMQGASPAKSDHDPH